MFLQINFRCDGYLDFAKITSCYHNILDFTNFTESLFTNIMCAQVFMLI